METKPEPNEDFVSQDDGETPADVLREFPVSQPDSQKNSQRRRQLVGFSRRSLWILFGLAAWELMSSPDISLVEAIFVLVVGLWLLTRIQAAL